MQTAGVITVWPSWPRCMNHVTVTEVRFYSNLFRDGGTATNYSWVLPDYLFLQRIIERSSRTLWHLWPHNKKNYCAFNEDVSKDYLCMKQGTTSGFFLTTPNHLQLSYTIPWNISNHYFLWLQRYLMCCISILWHMKYSPINHGMQFNFINFHFRILLNSSQINPASKALWYMTVM